MPSPTVLFYALSGGILPVLLWLWFWLREDRAHPEPRSLIFLSFLGGMLAVMLVLPLQYAASKAFHGFPLILVWASMEEILKFSIAYVLILRRREVDEPIDCVIYMIITALGFAALENTLFLLNPIRDGSLTETLLTGNFRFIGATLLHTISSGAIGVAFALSFCRVGLNRGRYIALGLITAITLHTFFNIFIMNGNGNRVLTIFLGVWIGIIILLLFFERIKQMKQCRVLFTKASV